MKKEKKMTMVMMEMGTFNTKIQMAVHVHRRWQPLRANSGNGKDRQQTRSGRGWNKEVSLQADSPVGQRKGGPMKGYLLNIASVEQSDDTPLAHLECHQAGLLNGGNQKSYKMLETFTLVTETFPLQHHMW